MNKEKEIEEMAEVMIAVCDDCNDCKFHKYGNLCIEAQQAERLYEAGYRKAEEVRKETAKEILHFLKGYITDGLLKNHEILNALIKYYGVEV